jgi:hypothetical protein
MDVHTSDRIAERGRGASGVCIGERDSATWGPAEEEVRRRKRRHSVGTMEATGRRPLPEEEDERKGAGVGASE